MKATKLLPIVGMALFMSVCRADTVNYSAYLLGSTVVPPTLAPATATETLTVSGDLLSAHVDFTGLLSSALGVRIHCCADTYTNAPVVLNFPDFPSATSGSYDHTFSLSTDLSGISVPEFLSGLSSELAYTDLTSRNFPTGSIRGQLAAVAPVPEPIPLALLSSGMALCAALRSRLGQSRRDP
jgi:hypothetical protein